MQILPLNAIDDSLRLVAAVGFFDGVHAGHRYLIAQVRAEAERLGLPSAVVTFREHPQKVLRGNLSYGLLCEYDEKMELLAQTGLDYCIVLDFDQTLSKYSARQFITDVLWQRLHVATLFVGYDHRFGYNREEGYYHYKNYGEQVGMQVLQAQEFAPAMHLSSTHIRKLLDCGEVSKAASLLTYNYRLRGVVVEGFKIGRTIGYPTANVSVCDDEKLVPANGIYAVWVHLEHYSQRFKGMLYIGNRPTLSNDGKRSIEVNIFDFADDIYTKGIVLEFVEFVRGDHHFASITELTEQIARDKDAVLALMSGL